MKLTILTEWGEATRNRLHLRATKLDNIAIGVLIVALLVVPAYIPVAGWQILASYTFIFMLSAYLCRLSWREYSEKTAT